MKVFIVGLIVPVVSTTSLRLLGVEYTSMWYFLPLMIGYGLLGWMAWSGAWKQTLTKFLVIYAAIPIAVLVDATVDWYIWSNDRNLFPLEIILIFIACQIPLFIGAVSKKLKGT